MKKLFQAAMVALMLVPSWGLAQDYDKGWAAYLAGDYATALQEWRPLAEQGFAHPQYILGLMYYNGRGVLQDDVLAHMWYNIAGANGNPYGSEGRGEVEQRMTREQIAKAQALARRCMASDYQDCD